MDHACEAVGLIGLGALGQPIAQNLLDAGYRLSVHNRTASKADDLLAQGARWAPRAADAVPPGGVVISLLWDDASVEALVRSEDFLERLAEDGVHVSMSTLSPEGSRRIAALHARHGCTLVEAPVFGRPEAARVGRLIAACVGPEAAKQRVSPVLAALGVQQVFDFGAAFGHALTVKLIGNFLIFCAAAALEEGLTLARHAGLDPRAVANLYTSTLFASPVYVNYARMITEGASPFGDNAIPAKDLDLLRQASGQAGAPAAMADFLRATLLGQGRES
ncbi:NAD(P)-dependent oxidoreductase [Burkholderia plantarii]|uniref:NAD(P)-dependent oxidoreductase n=1 Tax=Burkholderia plantarii TaxID=41899 RepID=UPI000870B2CC|nr:NAD(P)-dependent oxidoreductase [Burkholderia plantarii]